ncbi:MAG: hypothetical protein HYV93_16330 [Candidatus Rokubacteria bacterium]|nr:hypothetical protein [Candidatus Rokubacteria bacterium]
MSIHASQSGAQPWHPADYGSPLCRCNFATLAAPLLRPAELFCDVFRARSAAIINGVLGVGPAGGRRRVWGVWI